MILIACEESQIVTKEFRKIGIEAFSCDTEACSGCKPEWHLQEDVIPLLEKEWDLIIAFPPCTHLSGAGRKWFPEKIKDGRMKQGIDFFMKFINAKCKRKAIENPLGIMTNIYRKQSQIIQPYEFGDSFSKRTCLWLFNLPCLTPTKIVDKGEFHVSKNGKRISKWCHIDVMKLEPKERARARSKTFLGIAKAMASQWGPIIKGEKDYPIFDYYSQIEIV
jgi:site-specific DNA-cytosine methylase